MNSMLENVSEYVLLLNFVVSPSKSIKSSSILQFTSELTFNCHSEIVL